MTVSKELIRQGYNRISHRYRNDRGEGSDAKNMRPWLKTIQAQLKRGSDILELGCGMGVPAGKFFAAHHRYLGVDISDVQIQRAKKLVPKGYFRRADMSGLKFSRSSLDTVLSFYAIIHLSLGEQRPLIRRIHRWLRPGGKFVVILGQWRWTGKQKDWFGAEMFWSHTDQVTYRQWLKKAGFKIQREVLIKEGKSGHPLFFCEKSANP